MPATVNERDLAHLVTEAGASSRITTSMRLEQLQDVIRNTTMVPYPEARVVFLDAGGASILFKHLDLRGVARLSSMCKSEVAQYCKRLERDIRRHSGARAALL